MRHLRGNFMEWRARVHGPVPSNMAFSRIENARRTTNTYGVIIVADGAAALRSLSGDSRNNAHTQTNPNGRVSNENRRRKKKWNKRGEVHAPAPRALSKRLAITPSVRAYIHSTAFLVNGGGNQPVAKRAPVGVRRPCFIREFRVRAVRVCVVRR